MPVRESQTKFCEQVDALPTSVPASRNISGRVVSLQSSVVVTVANLPRGALASNVSGKLDFFDVEVIDK